MDLLLLTFCKQYYSLIYDLYNCGICKSDAHILVAVLAYMDYRNSQLMETEITVALHSPLSEPYILHDNPSITMLELNCLKGKYNSEREKVVGGSHGRETGDNGGMKCALKGTVHCMTET